MIIVNSGKMDCHAHTMNFSDGMATVEEMVRMASEMGMDELWLTDHSDASIKFFGFGTGHPRSVVNRWLPVQENIEVKFGIECDLLNETGEVCDQIQGQTSEYLLISAHPGVYTGRPEMITEAYVNVIRSQASRFKFVGHPCAKYFAKHLKIDELVDVANEYNVPLELNCANLFGGRTDTKKLEYLLDNTERIYLNSDAHTLQQLRDYRKRGFEFLKAGEWQK